MQLVAVLGLLLAVGQTISQGESHSLVTRDTRAGVSTLVEGKVLLQNASYFKTLFEWQPVTNDDAKCQVLRRFLRTLYSPSVKSYFHLSIASIFD